MIHSNYTTKQTNTEKNKQKTKKTHDTVSQQTEKQMILNRYLGVLTNIDNKFKVFGYITNTNVIIIVVTRDISTRENEIRNCFTALHQYYVRYIFNPFVNIEEPIISRSFRDAMFALDKKFSIAMVKPPNTNNPKNKRGKSMRK